jgi:translation initiation factor 1
MSEKKLVYSTDPDEQKKLNTPVAHKSKVSINQFTAIFRLEKNHRGGKTVTVIAGLPEVDDFLKNLTKEIKSKCGVGGTYLMKEGIIEIQGDQREKIKKIFDQKQIKYKGM